MDKEKRLDELRSAFEDCSAKQMLVIERLLRETVDLEERLDEIKGYGMVMTNGRGEVKVSPMSRLRKDYLGQYANLIRILLSMSRKDGGSEDEKSPLRKYFESIEYR